MIILNIPPHLRSKIDNIKLVILCFDKHIASFGWEKLLKKLVADLQELETNGITIFVDGQTTTFYGTLIAILGDSLGSHQIGGYTENFSKSNNFCRYCEISRDDFLNNFFRVREWRTIETYTKCVEKAKKSKNIEIGIKRDCPFNILNYFHVANPGLPPCVAHDLFEGIVQSDMWLAIRYFVQQNWFRTGLLNFRLNDIKLLSEGAIFIPQIQVTGVQKKKLTGTASQMRRLMQVFTAVVADVVKDFNDPVWRMVTHLKKVCQLVCAPALSMGQIASLAFEIRQFLELRKECFPNDNLKPKHEFIYHYPKLMELFGPLKHLWTLRFESKHGDFKKQVKHIQNFKNLTQRLAYKHQLKQASNVFKHDTYAEAEKLKKYDAQDFKDDAINQAIRTCFEGNHNSDKFISEKVKFRGILYAKDMSICIGKNKYGNFLICTIYVIVINANKTEIAFIGPENEIIYNEDVSVFQHYEDEINTSITSSFSYSSLLSPDPLPQLTILSTPVYVPKYQPFDSNVQE